MKRERERERERNQCREWIAMLGRALPGSQKNPPRSSRHEQSTYFLKHHAQWCSTYLLGSGHGCEIERDGVGCFSIADDTVLCSAP